SGSSTPPAGTTCSPPRYISHPVGLSGTPRRFRLSVWYPHYPLRPVGTAHMPDDPEPWPELHPTDVRAALRAAVRGGPVGPDPVWLLLGALAGTATGFAAVAIW